MIEKLYQLRDEASDYEVGCKVWDLVEKINEIIEHLNRLETQKEA